MLSFKKKIILILVVIAFVCGNNLVVLAETRFGTSTNESIVIASGECGNNINWKLTDDGVFTIEGTGKIPYYNKVPWEEYKGVIKEVVIKDGVTSICSYAFSECNSLVNVQIASTVTEIGDLAFNECMNLEKINIPETVNYLGYMTFSDCASLKSINIPTSIESIEMFTFSDCISLEEVFIPPNVKYIEYGAFQLCEELKAVTFNKGLIEIGKYAFADCIKLKSVVIPETVTSIKENAFLCCLELGKVEFETTSTMFPTFGNNVFLDLQNVYFIAQTGTAPLVYADLNNIKSCDLINHKVVIDSVLAPTCEETGLTEGSHCSVCGIIIITQSTVDAKGHSWSEWIVVNEPTTHMEGLEKRVCSVCGHAETEIIEKLEAIMTGWQFVDDVWYYYDANGVIVTGWHLIGDVWYCFDAQGCMLSEQWIDNTYYVGANGAWIPNYQKITAGWRQNSIGWWYQNADGSYPYNEWSYIDGAWYYFDGSGYMLSNQWIGNYYLSSSGAMLTNAWTPDGYYVGSEGARIPDYQSVQSGWKQNDIGWWYQNADGSYPYNEWSYIDGAWYYFDGSGYMLSNQWIGNYYLSSSGAMLTNAWTPDGYYVGSDGVWIPNYA